MSGRRRGTHRRVVVPATNIDPAAQDGSAADGDPAARPAPAPAAPAGTAARAPAGATQPVEPRQPAERVVPDRAAEDTDRAWGRDAADSNEERLLGDKPPHWQ